MLKLRIKQRYLLISCLSLILGMYIFSYFNGFNYLDIIFKIYPEEFPNFSSYMVQVFHFDKFFSDATHYFRKSSIITRS